MTDVKTYTVQLLEDEDGEMILPFPDELLKELDWKPGDQLLVTENGDGTYSITKDE